MTNESRDFMLEKRLSEEAPDLHTRVKDCVVSLQRRLESFITWFPDYTDHSMLHSMDVLDFCNRLLDRQVFLLTLPECYALVMSCYLHDAGMGVTRSNYRKFSEKIDLEDYRRRHPDAGDAEIIREFHHEFSGQFIRTYSRLFEIPSEELLFAIVQISRGHRRTDLFDETEYPDIQTPEGVIRTSFLAAVLRLADEIDVGAERNPEILFDISKLTRQHDIDIFGIHESILRVEVNTDRIILHTRPKEPRLGPMIEAQTEKIQATLDYCRAVAEKRSGLRITQEKVETVPYQ